MPMPLPSTWLSVVLLSLSKASKRCFRNSSDIPIPLSVTVIAKLHQSSFSEDVCAIWQDIDPPALVYFIAFLMMLRQISDTCGASIYTYGYKICSVMESVWFLLSACCWNMVIQFSKFSRTFETVYSISVLLFSILARFRTLLSSDRSSSPQTCIFSRYLLSFSVSFTCLVARFA